MESVRPNLERKLEVIAYLRNCSEENKQKLQQVNDILYNGANSSSISNYDAYDKPEINDKYDSRNKKTKQVSFYQRLVLSGLFLFLSWFAFQSKDMPFLEEYNQYVIKIISLDYSENIFDFIQNLPYTLTYEKTNA